MGYWIITGASRGLGYALAHELLLANHRVFGLGRSQAPQFPTRSGFFQWFPVDLSDPVRSEMVLQEVFQAIPKTSWTGQKEELVLVNNAGMVGPIKPAQLIAGPEFAANMTVNLLSPMILSSVFSRLSSSLGFSRAILNISSGAGRKPYQGWSAYCAAKAGLDRFSQAMSLDEAHQKTGLEVYSLAPGIIDTEMQQEIRNCTNEEFMLRDQFAEYKQEGKLMSPVDCAKAILSAYRSGSLKSGELQTLKDL